MISRERGGKGDLHGSSKITEMVARQIKDLLAQGYTVTSVSESLGVSMNTIKLIKYGYTWKGI